MEKVVLIGAITAKTTESEVNEYLRELEFLAFTAGGDVKKIFKQKINQINAKTFLGKGKIHQISNFITDNEIDTAIFDDELTPSQQKNFSYQCCLSFASTLEFHTRASLPKKREPNKP